MQLFIHILTIPILYGLSILTLFKGSLYYRKAIRVISFQPQNAHSSLFSQKNNILKFSDKTMIDNILFISKALNIILPPIIKKFKIRWLR